MGDSEGGNIRRVRVEDRDEVGGRHTPMQNAPPKSLSVTHGHGSREWSIVYGYELWAGGVDLRRAAAVKRSARGRDADW